jgi:hypothetical protein
MNADAKLDPAFGRQPRIAFDHAVLHLDRAAHGVDHAAEFDEAAVAGAFDDAAVMRGDGGIDEIAAQAPEPRQRAILVRSRKTAVADDVRDQDRRDFPGSRDGGPSRVVQNSTRKGLSRASTYRKRTTGHQRTAASLKGDAHRHVLHRPLIYLLAHNRVIRRQPIILHVLAYMYGPPAFRHVESERDLLWHFMRAIAQKPESHRSSICSRSI